MPHTTTPGALVTDRTTERGFPAQVGEVTPEWLTEALRAGGAIGSGDTVVGFSPTVLGEGAGMLGVVSRLDLDYEGGDGPLPSVIAKFAATNEGNRAVGMTFRVYEREVRFYQELANQVGRGVTECFAAELDAESGDNVMLLEDLQGYREGDQAAGCGVDDAEISIDVIAVLHAAWWGTADRPELSFVPRIDGELYMEGMAPGAAAGYEAFLENFGHLVPDELRAAGPEYLDKLKGLHQRMGQGVQTLCHGDFRLDNLLFGTSSDQPPLKLIDWQGIIVSKGTQDLAYLLSQNLLTEERRQHERALVERYHQRLVDEGVTGYSAEQCWDDYRLACLWLWEYAIIIGGTLDPSNERGRAFMSALISRSAATIVDLDLLELL